MLQHLPNFITLLNLGSGFMGIIAVFQGSLSHAVLCVWLGIIFDFLDGFVARLLRVHSLLGKQLDSLADLVTFGVAPGLIVYRLIQQALPDSYLSFVAYLVPLGSALRLAKFNIDERQQTVFYGLPTTGNALFLTSLSAASLSPYVMAGIVALSSWLLIANIPFFAFKFNNYSWNTNRTRYVLLAASIVLTSIWRVKGIGATVGLYIIISLVKAVFKSQKNKK